MVRRAMLKIEMVMGTTYWLGTRLRMKARNKVWVLQSHVASRVCLCVYVTLCLCHHRCLAEKLPAVAMRGTCSTEAVTTCNDAAIRRRYTEKVSKEVNERLKGFDMSCSPSAR